MLSKQFYSWEESRLNTAAFRDSKEQTAPVQEFLKCSADMSSQRRAPQIPDIPPFSSRGGGGGPLQPRHAPNQTHFAELRSGQKPTVSSVKSTASSMKPVMAPPLHPVSHHEQQRRQQQIARDQQQQQQKQQRESKPSSSSHRERGSSRAPQSEAEPRPSSRLANEKKKDYKDPPNIGPWKLGKLIGQGASGEFARGKMECLLVSFLSSLLTVSVLSLSGRVRHAVHTSTGVQAAVKIVPKQILATSRMSMRDVSAKQDKMTLGIEREIVIMKLIEHPNLLGLMDVYETSKELFLILEYVAGGELFDYLVSKGRLRPSEARSYFRQIIFGLHYCHSFNICHRDLKPENLLLDGSRKVVKVADFGMAALQPSEKMLETSCGSPHYASPEIVSGKSYKGTASDIWSCGIILFALLCGRLPFDDPNIQTLLGKVRLGKFDMPDYLEPLAKDLIWRMLVVDPERRLTMREIMRHPWFTDNGNLSEKNPVETDLDKLAEDQLDFESLDMDILNNLKTLWPEYSQSDIVDQLTSRGTNWQKTFYTLLVQHRENYSGDDDEEEEEAESSIFNSGYASPAKGTNSLGLSLGINPSQQNTSSKEKARPRRSIEGSSSSEDQTIISAPAATPSPRKPLVRANTDRPSSPIRSVLDPPRSPVGPRSSPKMGIIERPSPNRAYSDTSQIRPSTISPVKPLPSPSPSPVKTMNSPAHGFGSARHAQQAVKVEASLVDAAMLSRRATSPANGQSLRFTSPAKTNNTIVVPSTPTSVRTRSSSVAADDSTPKAVEVNNSTRSRPSSRAGSTASSSRRPTSSYGEPKGQATVGVPQIGDGSMQQFFREIADELASLKVQGGRPESLQLKLEQLEKVAASMQAMGARKPRDDDGMAQFDDAEDDVEDDQYSVRSGTTSDTGSHPYTPTSPMPLSLASPTMKTEPLAFVDRPRSNITTTPALSSTSSQTSSAPSSLLGRRRSLLLGRKKSERKVTSGSEASSTISAYERLQEAGARGGQTKLQQKNPGLGLDIGLSGGGPAPMKSPALSGFSAPPTPNTPGTPSLMSPSMNSSPKQSWFAGLFNWKPATASLMSTENFSITHAETKRLLLNSGARVFVEDSENAGVLKCSLTEGKEINSKPLRFRVEFQILPMSSLASPALGGTPKSAMASPALSSHSNQSQAAHYATCVNLIQEKGSLASFKSIYHSLKRTWTLDIANGSAVPDSPITPAYNVGLGVSGVGAVNSRAR